MNKEFWKNKRVLITGNNGFKGCWLTKILDNAGAEILGISLAPEKESIYNELEFSEKYKYMEFDIRDYKCFESAVEDFRPEIIFHLAAQAIVKTAKFNPYDTFEINMMGTLNLLEILREKNYVKSVVIVTSDKVYKNIETQNAYTEESEIGGNEPYSSSKACQEIIAYSYRNTYFSESGTGIATARAANVFGGGDNHFDRLIPYLIQSSLNGEKPVLRNPDAVRPWQYILDLLNGYIMLAEKLYESPEKYAEGWNFAPDKSVIYTVADIAEVIWNFVSGLEYSIDKSSEEQKFKESMTLIIDSAKSNSLLGWEHLYSLADGMGKTVDFYRRYFSGESADKIMSEQIEEFQKKIMRCEMKNISELKELAKDIRLDVLKMTYEKKAGFIGSSFSCADILAVLYGYVMRYDKNNMNKEGTDVFFLSKGHAASAWYAALANVGIIEKSLLDEQFHVSGYKMGVHPKMKAYPGITASSGSLGQGAGQGAGYALANKIKKSDGRVYVLLGDGECNEGSSWEAFMFAKKNNLDNFTVIVDRNKLQSYGHDEDVLNMGDMKSRFESFGFYTVDIDGNDIESLVKAFDETEKQNRPCAIIANTIKGKGFSGFEDKVLWHYKWPETEHYNDALNELNA